jgi:predicted NBD/HSP70 family sugar kinase
LAAIAESRLGVARHSEEALVVRLGYGIANCINILAPSNLIVTGRLVAADKVFIGPLQEAINKFATTENLSVCNLVFDDSQNNLEAIGAGLATLLQDDFILNVVSNNGARWAQ